jgi:hypothetical protein
MARIAGWLIPLAVIVGFTWLEVLIVRLPEDGLRTILLSLAVLVEFALIGIGNSLLG